MRAGVAAGLLACLAAPVAACDTPRPFDFPASLVRGGADLAAAWFAGATTIYDHGILGDAVEAAMLTVQVQGRDCPVVTVAAGAGHVFEDTAPRLADLDGDGRDEVIVVRSSLTKGAQLALYGLRDGALTLLAATPYIGQTHRWLAPVGAGDLDGDGRIEVAYIDRPHLDRVLRIWRFDGASLTEAYRVPGLTNHRIGDRTITGGIRTCDGGTEAVTADAGWSRVVATRIAGDRAVMRDLGPMGPDALSAALRCGG